MKKIIWYTAFFLLFLSSIGGWLLLKRTAQVQEYQSTEFVVVCTTEIIADLVRHLGGDRVRVHALMGPGVDPHLYHARESDVRLLSSAHMILYNGLHLEGKMVQLFHGMSRQLPTYAVAEVVPEEFLRPSEFEGLYDPHIWFDVKLWRIVAEYISTLLIRHDPVYADMYRDRACVYLCELDNLDAYVQSRVSELPAEQRILITAHDAFSYFGEAYGFEVIGLQGISTDSEVGTADVIELAKFIVRKDVRCLFSESSIPRRNIEAVQQAVAARGGAVQLAPELYSDSLGELNTPGQDYIGMVTYNCESIVNALKVNK